jgi:hypothetical protein
MVRVTPEDDENPSFQSHFGNLSEHVRDSLTIFLEFVIRNFWANNETYRASIFLYDAHEKELKRKVVYNMGMYTDLQVGFKSSS